MKLPSLSIAKCMIHEAGQLNPGLWVEHSFFTAQAAESIANNCPQLNPEDAYILGLLHDIGRREGKSNIRHIIDGYAFLKSKGYDDAAQISLTHSFPYKDINIYFGEDDCTEKEREFINDYLNKITFNIYDRLIQLCDAVASAYGFCLLEKRFIDVAMRCGADEKIVLKWEATFQIKDEFEKYMGKSIYQVLPGVIENTFELSCKELMLDK